MGMIDNVIWRKLVDSFLVQFYVIMKFFSIA